MWKLQSFPQLASKFLPRTVSTFGTTDTVSLLKEESWLLGQTWGKPSEHVWPTNRHPEIACGYRDDYGWWRPSRPNSKGHIPTCYSDHSPVSYRQLGSVNLKSCEQPQPASAMFSLTRTLETMDHWNRTSKPDGLLYMPKGPLLWIWAGWANHGKPGTRRFCGSVLVLKTGRRSVRRPPCHHCIWILHISCLGCLQARQAPEGSAFAKELEGTSTVLHIPRGCRKGVRMLPCHNLDSVFTNLQEEPTQWK